jgi:hypothetical protein|tara:strand:+ start:16203 stop:16886 length:684 start_codon:yes stop_codon:yes gene_type:complete
MKTTEARNDWHCRLYRHFQQGIVLHPSKEADLGMRFGDVMSSGVDITIMGLEGVVTVKDKTTNYQVNVDADTSDILPKFTVTLKDGTTLDLSKVKVAVDFDYHKALFPSKLEKFGKPAEIKDTGELSGDMLEHFESLDLEGKYNFCTNRTAYLNKLLEAHKLEEKKLVYRFEQSGKKLYTQRHLLLISRVDAVKANLFDMDSWTKGVLLTMEKQKMVGEGFTMKASA